MHEKTVALLERPGASSDDHIPLLPDLGVAVRDPMTEAISDYTLFLRAEGKSPQTIRKYSLACRKMQRYVVGRGVASWPGVTRTMVRRFQASLEEAGHSPSHCATLAYALRSFFGFLVDEEVLDKSPMSKVKIRKVNAPPVEVLTEDQLKAMIADCRKITGRTEDFSRKRSEALIRVMADTGVRLSELAGLTVEDLDLAVGRAYVHGKGSKDRYVHLGIKTVMALRRYLKLREQHPHAASEWLWLGIKGPITQDRIYQIIVNHALAAGVTMHPHQLRHTFSHFFLLSGGQVNDLASLNGWASVDMAMRYAASTAQERAGIAARQRSLGDRI